MNKYGIKGKAKQATQLILTCILAGLCMWFVYELSKRFSSPSSEVGVDSSAPAFILRSTMDVQRELNRRGYKLKVDGLCGPATQAALNAECANQYAIEFMIEEPTP